MINYMHFFLFLLGMPSFLNDQRLAALELTKRRLEQNNVLTPDKINVETKIDQAQSETSWMSWLFGYFLF